jgi:hypothetical protein
MAKRRTLTQQIADLNAQGLALMRDSADHSLRLAQIWRELEKLQRRIEAQRRRKAAHKSRLRAKRAKRAPRSVFAEAERFRKSVATRTAKLATTPTGTEEWDKTRIGLELAQRALAKYQFYASSFH